MKKQPFKKKIVCLGSYNLHEGAKDPDGRLEKINNNNISEISFRCRF